MRCMIVTVLLACGMMVSCRSRSKGELEAVGISPANVRASWLRSPESLEGTLLTSWGLSLQEQELWQYIGSVYSLLGGVTTASARSTLDTPNGLFVLTIDSAAQWIAEKLVAEQKSREQQGQAFFFEGLGLSDADSAGCYANDQEATCEASDEQRLNTITASSPGGAPLPALSLATMKRLRHNVGDIAEFLMLPVDDDLLVGDVGASTYLVDNVFLPTLKTFRAAGDANAEAKAWTAVTKTLLVGGGFFFDASISAL